MAPTESGLIDIPNECAWSKALLKALLFGLGIGAGAVLMMMIIGLAVGPKSLGVGFLVGQAALIATILTETLTSRRRQTNRIKAAVRANVADPRAAIRAAIGEFGWRFARHGVPKAIQELHVAGHRGIVFRVAPPDQLAELRPIAVEFEPTPINETDPAFVGLHQVDDLPLNEASDPPHAARAGRFGSSEAGRHFRRARKLGMAWVWAVFGFMFMIQAIKAVMTRRITSSLVIWGLALAASYFGPWLGASSTGLRFLMVPAGLLWRKAWPLQRNYTLHLFERRLSVMIICPIWRGRWMWAVSDGQRHAQSMNTREEVEMLVRTWLSPLPPPPMSRLAEMAG
ncbi:MAG: hypothetical protein HZB38_00785 [Planctomycetes bacterium]|nr:hypothetical protein [Planctomycetota bacterium]